MYKTTIKYLLITSIFSTQLSLSTFAMDHDKMMEDEANSGTRKNFIPSESKNLEENLVSKDKLEKIGRDSNFEKIAVPRGLKEPESQQKILKKLQENKKSRLRGREKAKCLEFKTMYLMKKYLKNSIRNI